MAQAASDSWLKEFEEAMRLADDILARINERNMMLASGNDPTRLVSATRRKITMLGTKLDRLESLLQNPPIKPSISEKEMYRRQDMLLGIRFRTKQMAAALSTSQPSNRATLMGTDSRSAPPEETSRTTVTHMKKLWYEGELLLFIVEKGRSCGQLLSDFPPKFATLFLLLLLGWNRVILKNLKSQDDDLAGLEATVTSTKHIALAVHEELDLQNHLLNDLDKDADDTNNRLKAAQRKIGILNKNSNRGCSVMCMCLMLLAIVLLVLIVLSLVKSL
ncbi:hypothetical protein AXG93_4382s1140 [Marchantia polymorpha subsp. ruderalis]|uniref:t-SNARE coiled-coil homology domain-containing protein n=1 Tax=Marchantia polymorpha subsp. ruderalis TaxID=1480154 RepID=A0A176VNL5_MARPO|nr:hypothetical protein AXG93_4382s1140 [Marchantia polymorpha subsp. ruderalis]